MSSRRLSSLSPLKDPFLLFPWPQRRYLFVGPAQESYLPTDANCLCPGAVATGLKRHAAEDRAGAATPPAELPRRRFAGPLARVSSPDEQAAAAAFRLSDDANYISGSALFIDGGLTAIWDPLG